MNHQLKVVLSAVLLLGLLTSCDKQNLHDEGKIHDPSQPIQITKFNPEEGSARTRLYIHGSNFGSHPDEIEVWIGGEQAKVVGSDGEVIYCIVPMKATEGTIEVKVGDKQAQANKKFKYLNKTLVSTLCGNVDETGKVKVQDGPISEAGFSGPNWMAVDPKNPNHVYVVDGWRAGGNTVRLIDLKEQKVTTVLQKGQGNWENIRAVCFSASGDSLFVVNQQDANHAIAVSYATRSNGFRKPQALIYGRKCFSVMCHPNGEVYYSNRITGECIRYDVNTHESKPIFTLSDGKGEACFFMFMHPEGNYAYFAMASMRTFLKAEYNWETHSLETPNIVCGKNGKEGFQDGQGVNALLGNPFQGCFVKNKQYVKEGKKDVYDFYFCDQFNHCIRILTPDGFVKTYAGRGSLGTNTMPFGYVDGDLKKEARFRYPSGIYFDDRNDIFYIGDSDNYRIRTIVVDE